MISIYSSRGYCVSYTKNLRALIHYGYRFGVQRVEIRPLASGKGELYVRFTNGAWCSTDFADFTVLQQWVSARRCMRSAPVMVIHAPLYQVQAV